jgi:hypothetical protein
VEDVTALVFACAVTLAFSVSAIVLHRARRRRREMALGRRRKPKIHLARRHEEG